MTDTETRAERRLGGGVGFELRRGGREERREGGRKAVSMGKGKAEDEDEAVTKGSELHGE